MRGSVEAMQERTGWDGTRAYWRYCAVRQAMTGADEWDNTRDLDAILEQANRPNYSPYDPIGLIRL